MKIDLSKFKTHWFEDEKGNKADTFDELKISNGEPAYYHRCFPCEINQFIDTFGYIPKNLIERFLMRKSKRYCEYMNKKHGRQFNRSFTISCSLGKESQRTAVAMVNSGDYELDEALWIMANACERCSNVLDRKYQGIGHGYEENSEEYKKCGTCCDFCKGGD